jgi:molecular chaperone DnaK (HSP70)
MGRIVGIDLGTNNSRVAIFQPRSSEKQATTIPSVLCKGRLQPRTARSAALSSPMLKCGER